MKKPSVLRGEAKRASPLSALPPADAEIIPLEESASLRGIQGVDFPQDMRDAAFYLYVTICNHDAAAVERMLRTRLPGEAIPTSRTIRNWARAEGWATQSDAVWRSGGKRTIYELRRAMVGNAILAQEIHRNAMTGAYDKEEPWTVAAKLKAAEQSNKMLERGVIALSAFDPPGDEQDTSELPLEERESLASARLAEDARKGLKR